MQWELELEACLKKLSQTKTSIEQSKHSVLWKLAIASKLKRESSVTNAWLSERLHMGVPNSVSNFCGKYRREVEAKCEYAKILENI